ncbi:hypothetical protein Taro_030205 [Colocasia esculenta]|uniref:non-specific serine/threonine protein kinase n=1 Tax=Colocasia esculenta TaxID=4460 RepID=A0A843W2M0_COLES|nr:hypothetical protein [Colocasia esculenta]
MASLPSGRDARPWVELAWDSGSPKIGNLMAGGCLAVIFSSIIMFMAASAGAALDEAAALLSFKLSSVEADPRNSLHSWRLGDGVSPDPCMWAGVVCSDADGRVRGLNLSSMGLVGRLAMDDLMSLQGLRDVDLSRNSFYGNLSHAAPSLSSPAPATTCAFEAVDLSRNNFTEGVVGGFLFSCNSLLFLNLSGNSIPGGGHPFPSSLRRLDLSLNRVSDNGLLNYSLSGGCRNLAYLNMSRNMLAGKLGLVSQECQNLALLDLSHNNLSGEIPRDFMVEFPPSLKELYLSYNNFSGDFSGLLLGPCSDLTVLDLSYNKLAGRGLPASLANCRLLERLDVSSNRLGGRIPSFWESFISLKHLSLSSNGFAGDIPPELAKTCATLTELDLSRNVLTGELPAAFTYCAALQSLDLGDNQLSGDFVENVVGTLPNLRFLRLAFNNISGSVPMASLRNCTKLEVVDLSSNQLSGEISADICPLLPSLQKLLLPNNLLRGVVPPGLGGCRNLRALDFSFNELSGPIPPEIWQLPELVDLAMWANNISGEIPDELCSRDGAPLETLILNHNAMTGSIPSSLTRCSNLTWVSLSSNRLVGGIPPRIGDLQNLAILQLGNNSLSGEIPPSLGSCRNLIWLDLSLNGLTGPIPPSLASQSGHILPGAVSGRPFAFLRNQWGPSCPGAGAIFESAGIRQERLDGFVRMHACPATRIYWGTMWYTFSGNGSMIYLDLSYNSLTGTIPDNLGSMRYLLMMSLGHNQLTGPIPTSFEGLTAVAVLDLSHNHLSGSIPAALGKLSFLVELDVSNNNLSGMIPSTGQLTTFNASRYENNTELCGVPLPPCRTGLDGRGSNWTAHERRRLLGGSTLIWIAVSLVFVVSVLLALYKLRKKGKAGENRGGYIETLPISRATSWKLSGAKEPLSINIAAFEKPLRKLTFSHLLEATGGFDEAFKIGSGGFGEVYRAQLGDGCIVAVKKLVHFAAGQGDREFTAEMETIGKIKHRNLAPLLGYCKVGEERLLVYEYMKHGSLDAVLHNRTKESPKLDWLARKRIATGAARGLAFLHHSCIPHVIHRDMKASNVLLDENLNARVSDFGMARLVSALDTHLSVSTLAGTPGYVPPEYYHSFRCTTKGDVYSYGVVLLELLSGKKPTDPSEFGDSNLVGWAKQKVREGKGGEVFDPELVGEKSCEEELHRYLKVACGCLDDRPLRRPSMVQVMAMFKELQAGTDSDVVDGVCLGSGGIDESKEKMR